MIKSTDELDFLSHRFLLTCSGFSLLIALTGCGSSEPPPAAVIMRPGVTLSADPNPVTPAPGGRTGKTTVYWKAPVKEVQLRLGSPNGTLWGNGPGTSHSETGPWVSNGMTFYLQDNTAPNPTDASATLAKLTVLVKLP